MKILFFILIHTYGTIQCGIIAVFYLLMVVLQTEKTTLFPLQFLNVRLVI